MSMQDKSLGTLLRHLLDLLDGDVQATYEASSLNYRPRYTPVVRALEELGPSSVRAIADHIGMTHSAVSQTVAQMVRAGLVEQRSGQDARQRIVSPAPALTAMLPRLRTLWAATNRAAAEWEGQLSCPLSPLILEAIRTLESEPFRHRIRKAGPPS